WRKHRLLPTRLAQLSGGCSTWQGIVAFGGDSLRRLMGKAEQKQAQCAKHAQEERRFQSGLPHEIPFNRRPR
ncbi:hypothetical protein ACC723_38455, partial [Rhizobium ruizarguesonis]